MTTVSSEGFVSFPSRPHPFPRTTGAPQSFVSGRMAIDSQTPQESSAKGRAKRTPSQGAERTAGCTGVSPTPKYNNLEEWFQDNSDQEITGEMEDVEVVRTFYTSRLPPKKDLDVWYADKEFGFYESLPKRVADLGATHINIEYPRKLSTNPKVELYVKVRDRETGKQRPRYMHELIEAVIYNDDDDDDWSDRLPKALTQWELVFPKGESWGVMRVIGFSDSPGPSRRSGPG